jgi:hypothetical protein
MLYQMLMNAAGMLSGTDSEGMDHFEFFYHDSKLKL